MSIVHSDAEGNLQPNVVRATIGSRCDRNLGTRNEMANDDELERALVDTLRKADLSELSADLTDKALDAIGSIPVVGILNRFWKLTYSVSARLLLKKMVRFLAEMKDVPEEERLSQIARLEVDTDERERIGETLLLLLDRLNDMAKPAMVGRAFKAYLKGIITREQFYSLSHAIDTLSVGHFTTLERFYKASPPDYMPGARIVGNPFSDMRNMNIALQGLAMCGLVSIGWCAETEPARVLGIDGPSERGDDVVVGGQIAYLPNEFGNLFYRVVLIAN